MFMVYGMIIAVLLLLSVEDLRKKEISWWKMLVLGIISIGGCFYMPQKNLWSMAGGAVLGLCIVGISMLTNGQIGMGDGIVTVLLGVLMGIRECLIMLCIASCCMAVISIVVIIIRKGNRHTTLPFIPALTAGYVATLVIAG